MTQTSSPPLAHACYTRSAPLPPPRLRELRPDQTDAGRNARYLLRGRKLSAKFRRPCRLVHCGVGFYCFERRPVIELEGGVHSPSSQTQDGAAKEDYLRTVRIRLLSFGDGLLVLDPENPCESPGSRCLRPRSDPSHVRTRAHLRSPGRTREFPEPKAFRGLSATAP